MNKVILMGRLDKATPKWIGHVQRIQTVRHIYISGQSQI